MTREPRDQSHEWSRYQHHILAELDRLSILVVDDHEAMERLHVEVSLLQQTGIRLVQGLDALSALKNEVSLLQQTSTRLIQELEKLGPLKGEVTSLKQEVASKTAIRVAIISSFSAVLATIGMLLVTYLKSGK